MVNLDNRSGRPYALTLDVIEKIAHYVRMGFSLSKAAAAVGIHENTLYKYKADAEALAEGRTTKEDYFPEYAELLLIFFESLLQANAVGEIEAVEEYNKLARQQKDLNAMFRMIERQYGRGKRVALPPVGTPASIEVLDMKPDDLRELSSSELEELRNKAKARELASGEEDTEE